MAAENPPLERAARRGYGLFRALQALRHRPVQPLYHAVLQHHAAVLQDLQPPHLRCLYDVSPQNLFHTLSLLPRK